MVEGSNNRFVESKSLIVGIVDKARYCRPRNTVRAKMTSCLSPLNHAVSCVRIGAQFVDRSMIPCINIDVSIRDKFIRDIRESVLPPLMTREENDESLTCPREGTFITV